LRNVSHKTGLVEEARILHLQSRVPPCQRD
jgi:hypothetical protein